MSDERDDELARPENDSAPDLPHEISQDASAETEEAADEPEQDSVEAAKEVDRSEEESESAESREQAEQTDEEDEEIDARLRRMSRRGFVTMAVAAGAGYAGWKWLDTRPKIDRRPWPLRRVLQMNERLAMAYYDRNRLSPTFPPSRIDRLRANGRVGLDPNAEVDGWVVTLHGIAGAAGPVEVSLDEIMSLPGYEMITQLRCIEGWSVVNRWTGTRLIELLKRYPPATRDGSPPDLFRRPERLVRYASMETPGRGYYVGLDMPSVIHPQTMLVWAMNGQPINWRHGEPLRLAIPVKYGIKNIKRLATIRFTDQRPGDYWAKRGYDWYAGF